MSHSVDRSTEAVSRFYDLVWSRYVPEYEASRRHLELFLSDAELRGKRVLDAGCGTGIFSLIMGHKGATEVIGIDISEGSLTTANQLAHAMEISNVRFMPGDMLALQFPDNSFDLIWAWRSVHHTTDPWRAMTELVRVAKDEATIVLALYKQTNLTWLHNGIRQFCLRLPQPLWQPISKLLALAFYPLVKIKEVFRKKARQGEKLEELFLDWCFVPIRHHFRPEDVRHFLKQNGFKIDKFLPGSGRFESSSNFIFKAKRELRK
ncbi:MAG: methyltransferase domain-containing protein [Chloroflexi bacterium]|nr:methyltransferase domain-containing protein [Chloroflexota bacterium]MCL5075282.1 methyltransferase domain-containing protein [Chloroflexota bacterium]